MVIGRTSTLKRGLCWRQSGRAASAPNTGRELNDIGLPSDASPTGAPSFVGSIATCAGLVRPTGGTGDFLLNFGLTSRSQPGSDSRRECPEWRPCVGSLSHAQQHGEVDDQEGVPAFQGCGNAD